MFQENLAQIRAKIHEAAYTLNTQKLNPEEKIRAVKKLIRHNPPFSLRAIVMPGMLYLIDGETSFASVEGRDLEITTPSPEKCATFPIGEIKSISVIPIFDQDHLYALKISAMRKQR
ncbi:MAG TPA: hypothetical protein PKA31_03840 [Candidatus Moranbacteria bacterium]|nr:hypothetical protein [Candidatus Moranbacteria bacterium]